MPGRLLMAAVLAVALIVGGFMYLHGERASARVTPTLAVLPFVDLSPQRDKEYFAEGVAEEILGILANDPTIKVIGRTSSWHFKGQSVDLRAIRKALGVTHILEGSARTDGDQLRMSVRLVKTSDGTQVWAEEYERRLANIFAVQDEIGRSVANRLRGALAPERTSKTRPMTGIDAYALYLAGRAKLRQRTEPAIRETQVLARKAISADPGYAAAYALMAEATRQLADHEFSYGTVPLDRARAQALPYAQQALRLAPGSAEGLAALGLIHFPNSEAIAPLKKAIELDPARAELRLWLGMTYDKAGLHAEALEQYRQVYAFEPLWTPAVNRLALTLAASGKIQDANNLLDRFEQQGGDPIDVFRIRAGVGAEAGDLSEMVRYARRAVEPGGGWNAASAKGYLTRAYYVLGFNDAATALAASGSRRFRTFLGLGKHHLAVLAVRQLGAEVWNHSEAWIAAAGVAAARRPRDLARLYDSKFSSPSEVCSYDPRLPIPLAWGLIKIGRASDGEGLIGCLQDFIALERRTRIRAARRSEAELAFDSAQLAALQGKNELALDLLKSAVQGGWRGHNHGTARLVDYPAFDSVRNDPRFVEVQQRLHGELARERAEVLRVVRRAA